MLIFVGRPPDISAGGSPVWGGALASNPASRPPQLPALPSGCRPVHPDIPGIPRPVVRVLAVLWPLSAANSSRAGVAHAPTQEPASRSHRSLTLIGAYIWRIGYGPAAKWPRARIPGASVTIPHGSATFGVYAHGSPASCSSSSVTASSLASSSSRRSAVRRSARASIQLCTARIAA